MTMPICPSPCNPCLDPADPISNYSSEAPDNFDPFCRGYSFGKNGHFNPPLQPDNPLANPFFVCFDQSPDCSAPVWPRCMPPDPNGPNSPSDPPSGPDDPLGPQLPTFCNDPQSCTVECPDLTSATVTIEPDRFCWFTKTQANRIAESEACKEARRRMICIGNLSRIVGCFGESFTSVLNVTSTQPVSFGVFDGTLPPGISITKIGPRQLLFIGTPTATGLFIFSIAVITPATDTMPGDEVIKPFAILIYAVDPDLVDGIAGETYSDQLELQGPTADVTNLTWQFVSGDLPPGLSLATDGTISGTVDNSATGIYVFTVQANITVQYATRIQTTHCQELLSINVTTLSDPIAYYDFQTLINGDTEVVDVINGNNLTGGGLTVGPGFIGNGWNSPNQANRTLDPTFDLSNKSFTVRFWVKSLLSAPYNAWLLSYDSTGGTGDWFFIKNSVNPDDIGFVVETSFPDFYTVLTPGFTTGTWHYIVATYEPGIRIGISLDNGAFAYTAVPVPIQNPLDSLRFRDSSGLVEFDEVAIWDRLLSAQEITDDYNGGAGRTWPF